MTDIKVSVIIPVYNVEKYLRQNLESVANQTLKDIEIICVDDGSTDSSFEIVKEFAEKDSRFIAVSQENGGAGAARHNGLRRAKGKYLSFLDSDDFFDEKTFTLNGKRVFVISRYSAPIPLGTDDRGVYEYSFDFYFYETR